MGASHDLVKRLDKLASRRGYELTYSVGWALTEREKTALRLVPGTAREAAIDAKGEVRERRADEACGNEKCGHRACWIEEAHVTELTGLLRKGPDGDRLKAWPKTMRVFARRERPHPGAQLTHRVHARVEDVIRTGKGTGPGHFPSRGYGLDKAWLDASMTACIYAPPPENRSRRRSSRRSGRRLSSVKNRGQIRTGGRTSTTGTSTTSPRRRGVLSIFTFPTAPAYTAAYDWTVGDSTYLDSTAFVIDQAAYRGQWFDQGPHLFSTGQAMMMITDARSSAPNSSLAATRGRGHPFQARVTRCPSVMSRMRPARRSSVKARLAGGATG